MATITFPNVTSIADFGAGDTEPSGVARTLPVTRVSARFDAAEQLPTPNTRAWRVVLVDDRTEEPRAFCPDATLGSITETLNDIGTASCGIPYLHGSAISDAASAIADADPLPTLGARFWRGDTMVMGGPVTDDQPGNDAYELSISDPSWWLSRRNFGLLGNDLGGVSNGLRKDFLSNPDFTTGLDGWQMLHTTAFGAGFAPIDPTTFTVVNTPAMPNGNPMLRTQGPVGDPNDGYRLFQDLIVSPSPNRALKIRFSGWIQIPTGGDYAPTTDRYGLVLAWLPYGTPTPTGYYNAVEDVVSADVDEDTPLDRLVPLHCEIEVPAGQQVALLHVGLCAPQGTAYWGGLSLRGDDGFFFYDQDPVAVAARLVEHASNPTYGKDDLNLDPHQVPVGDKVTREYVYEDHPNLLASIAGLSGDGWFDWGISYTGAGRLLNLHAPRRGTYRARAAVHLDQHGNGNVANIKVDRAWSSGATVVAAQDQASIGGKHERAARTTGPALEEVFTAGREPKDYDIAGAAVERLAVTSQPDTITIESFPGDDQLIVGVAVGDIIDVHSTRPGAVISGRCRIVQRVITPATDTVTITANRTVF